MSSNTADQEEIRARVREGYSKIAQAGSAAAAADPRAGDCCGGGCCGSTGSAAAALVKKIGYTESELAGLPESANMGLSCGNPTAVASLKAGETVLDLGSGGGFDAFMAGPRVGAGGLVIGVDMTPEMVAKARKNGLVYTERTGLSNVDFRLGEIEHLPVADASVDVVISNCVLNLSPNKPQVWKEIARVLKPGGRAAISDLALLRPLPDRILKMVEALVGCVAGAALVSETKQMALAAGLVEIKLVQKSAYIDALKSSKDPLYQKIAAALPPGTQVGDFITSLDLTARRP